MQTMFRCLATVALAVFLAEDAGAQTAALDLKLGLWEMSAAMDMPGVDMTKLPPEQAAMMKAMTAPPVTTKSCLTKDKLAKSTYELLLSGRGSTRCSQKLTTNTPTALDGTIECRGFGPSPIHIEAASPTSITGSLEVTNSVRGNTISQKTKVTGTWVGVDCGKTK
jgi:hypothetical protein